MIDIDPHIKEAEDRGRSSDCGSQDSGLPREPSFSGWCDEDGTVDLKHPLVNSSAVEDFYFEWPVVPQGHPENGFLSKYRYQYSESQMENMHHVHVGSNIDRSTALEEGNNTDKYVPFEVENGSIRERSTSHIDSHESDSIDNYKVSAQSAKSPISAANVLKTLFFILMWYTFSTFLTLYNKTLLGDDLGKFPAPLLMNTVHFAMQAIMSNAIIWLRSDKSQIGATMSWRDYYVRVVPTALATAMDVNLSNESLVVISVTFATMCKSAAPIFLLLFAFAFRLESPSFKLLGIITVISVGILLTVAKETEFDFLGFILVMLAAVMSGFRWCMTQILLQKEAYGLKDPITLMSYMTPVMAIATFLLSLLLDPWKEFKANSYFNNSWHVMRSCLLMFLGGTLAFFMVLTEYILVSVTSAVTVTIAGVVKEAVTIMVAVFYFHDEFTWLKGVGLVIIMFGVSLFNWYKYQKLQKGHANDNKIEELPATNAAAKYVILEETEDQENEI